MEIRKAAYELCKELAHSPARSLITEVIRSLNNALLSYYAPQYHAQVIGYLMVSQERDRFANKPFPETILPLEDKQLNLLAGFQKKIFDLNQECVRPLTQALPNCTPKALSPYNRFDFKMPAKVEDVDIFPKGQLDTLTEAFHSHPQIEIAINSSSTRPVTFSEEHYMQYVWEFEEDIKVNGILKTPEALRDIEFHEHRDSQRRTFLRHIAAVTSIRASLSVLNQLIYQKLFDDKLMVIDENSIIESGSYYFQSGGFSAIFQNAGLLLLADTDDIILAKTLALSTPELKLCRIEKLDPILGLLHIGEPRYIELRAIDENLNPYSAMLRSL